MKFNKNKYCILEDVGDTGVLLSAGAMRTIELLKKEAKEIDNIFGAFCKEVINNCEKGYFLSKKINDIISDDISVQERLNELLHELNPTKGIMLLPSFTYSSLFNSFAYYVEKNQESPEELNFSISFHSSRGLEMFTSGTFIKRKYQSLSFVSDDLEFYRDRDSVFESLVNYSLNILLFMQFAEIETVVTEGNNSTGKRKVKFNKEKYLNESSIPIEIIDSNWFRHLIRTGAFKVKGHFRLQPYGPNNSLRKLIWINEYSKKGYEIKPKILKDKMN